MRFTANTIAVLSTLSFTSALDPNCAPGNNIDLSKWTLQLPTGKEGSPTQISPDRLKGCNGYTDKYFNTDKQDGSVIMKVPGDKHNSECVSTQNSDHCRCEFRENSPHAWDPKGPVNRLFGDLRIAKNDGEICVGQIHIDETTSSPKSHKPVAELYVNSQGELNLGVQLCATNDCTQQREPVGKIDPTKRWNYEIRYEKNVLSVSINKGAFKTFTTHKLNAPPSYFKAGNYNQKSGVTEVHFYDIRVTHDANDGGSNPGNPGNPGPDCDGPPAVDTDSTVTLKLFAEETCCKSVQRLKLGEPNSCHNSNAPFKGFNQAVGQKMFGRNIKIVTFEGRDCAGASATNNLTNNPQCYNNSGKAWNSFMISDK